MSEELLRASDFRIVTFLAFANRDLDGQVNDWLQEQSADIVVYNMMTNHALASSGITYPMTIAYGNKPRLSGTC